MAGFLYYYPTHKKTKYKKIKKKTKKIRNMVLFMFQRKA